MDIFDFLLSPIYLAVFFLLARRTVAKNANNPLYGQYYLRGLAAKFFATIFFALIYIFYYKGGDSLAFYFAASPLYKYFFTHTVDYLAFVSGILDDYPVYCWREVDAHGVIYLIKGSASLTTIRVTAVLNLICFNSYISLCLLFAYISYAFQWRAFELLASIYPSLHKNLALPILFIPSVLFWGSGVGKDSIMLSSILLVFCSFYSAVILKQQIARNAFFLLCGAVLMSLIRGFILFTIMPSLVAMAVVYYRNSIQSSFLKIVIGPVLLVLGVGVSFLFIQSLGSTVSSYSIDSLQQKAEGFRSWHSYLGETQGGSAYSLGENIEYTPLGILRQAPMAILITLFGPFIWQVRNPIMLLSAVESIVLMFLTLRVVFNKRIYSLLGILIKDHIVVFCIIFVIVISIAIGLTSFNYGALVRYRIPVLPFFGVLLVLVNNRLSLKM